MHNYRIKYLCYRDYFECIRSYLAKGLVEKLEVVNKKWVRVRLSPGNATDASVSTVRYNIIDINCWMTKII